MYVSSVATIFVWMWMCMSFCYSLCPQLLLLASWVLNKLHCTTLRSSFSNNSDCNPNTVNTITQNWYICGTRKRRRNGDMVALNPIKLYDSMDTYIHPNVYKKERAKLLALNCYWHWIFRLWLLPTAVSFVLINPIYFSLDWHIDSLHPSQITTYVVHNTQATTYTIYTNNTQYSTWRIQI